MTTSMNAKQSVTLSISDTLINCSEFLLSKDKHAITICMSIYIKGTANLLLSVNNFFIEQDGNECYAQHCYINDGRQFEVISGWKSFVKGQSYTVITKYNINPNLPTYNLCYKTANQVYPIISLKG